MVYPTLIPCYYTLQFYSLIVKAIHFPTEEEEEEIYCAYEKNNTNSDVTTSTKVLCRAARIAETITAWHRQSFIFWSIIRGTHRAQTIDIPKWLCKIIFTEPMLMPTLRDGKFTHLAVTEL